MKSWQRNNLLEWPQKVATLEAEGYEVQELSEYHFRITCDWSEAVVDIWPSTGRFMQTGAASTDELGGDIINSLSSIFDRVDWARTSTSSQ